MRFAAYRQDGIEGLAAADAGLFRGYPAADSKYPGNLSTLVARGNEGLAEAARVLLTGPEIDLNAVELLPPLPNPPKILCVGLNYADHSAESGFAVPSYPTIFGRFASSLIGHRAPIVRPHVSDELDYEGEFVAVIGRGGRDIPKASALDHVIAYSLFNDASIRDYQFKAPQWTVGKNNGQSVRISMTLALSDLGWSRPTNCRRAARDCCCKLA